MRVVSHLGKSAYQFFKIFWELCSTISGEIGERRQAQPSGQQKTDVKTKINKSSSAVTLVELLVVIAIIAVLAALGVSALASALAKAQMTGTMNNARQLYLAQFQMSNDGAATANTSLV